MQSREEVLKIYPDAVYFPSKDPPIGEIVKYHNEGFIVTGAVKPKRNIHKGTCPYCICEGDSTIMEGWWIVRAEKDTSPWARNELCVYPPTLERV